jgi:hypothetical protein
VPKPEIWPNFFLVGAAKAGTTSIYEYLSQHPQVFFPKIKEPHFFTQVCPSHEQRFFIEAIRDRTQYVRLFEKAEGFEIVGDASPSYLWHPEVPGRIRAQVPDARIAIILRDPVERAYSHYLMDYREGVQSLPFYDALMDDMNRPQKGWGISSLYFELGQYAEQVERYLLTFPPDRIRIAFFDDLRRDVRGVLKQLAEFLGIDSGAIEQLDTSKKHNSYAAPRNEIMRRIAGSKASRILGHLLPPQAGQRVYEKFFLRHNNKPPIDTRARDFLCELYEPEIMKLEHVIGGPLPQLRSSWSSA